jgi:hypothetical protein
LEKKASKNLLLLLLANFYSNMHANIITTFPFYSRYSNPKQNKEKTFLNPKAKKKKHRALRKKKKRGALNGVVTYCVLTRIDKDKKISMP